MLAAPDLAVLCPRLEWARVDEPTVEPGERVCWRVHALIRVHGAIGATDARPLRTTSDPDARLLALAAGAGPVVLTDRRVAGVLLATLDRPALAFALDWVDVDDVAPARSGGVRLLSTRLVGGLTVDPVGPACPLVFSRS